MDEIFERYQYDERQEFVVEAIEGHLEDKKQEINKMD
jgi:metal-responsive CopG/Arc/MetJ family transcriptional regulator